MPSLILNNTAIAPHFFAHRAAITLKINTLTRANPRFCKPALLSMNMRAVRGKEGKRFVVVVCARVYVCFFPSILLFFLGGGNWKGKDEDRKKKCWGSKELEKKEKKRQCKSGAKRNKKIS